MKNTKKIIHKINFESELANIAEEICSNLDRHKTYTDWILWRNPESKLRKADFTKGWGRILAIIAACPFHPTKPQVLDFLNRNWNLTGGNAEVFTSMRSSGVIMNERPGYAVTELGHRVLALKEAESQVRKYKKLWATMA